ncbi:autotransporter assembly complex family protein [Methylopila sp. M107]|uniref:autotransporter assembly complex protein TamA n=1 Tax=Methylopila sp. M107 TaxID=1101190 RepID=UPI000363E95C|nr:autotransporter assembly complex family protein [Methylopila sp. M107]
MTALRRVPFSAFWPRLVAVGLACALTEAGRAQSAPDAPPPAAASAVPGVAYVTTFQIDGADADVEKIATETSSLKTLEKEPPPGPPGLVGRAKADIERIAAALTATGRYGAIVDVTVGGVSVNSQSAPDAAQRARKPVPVVVVVHQGPVFTFGSVRVQPLDGPASRVEYNLKKAGLEPGKPAPSAVIFGAESRIVDQLRADGYPFAVTEGREATADHTRKQLDLVIKVKAGPRAPFGEITVSGTKEVDPRVVRGRVPFEPGDQYDPEKVRELREEVAKLDVFSSIRIREGEKPDASGRVPVTIEVEEKKFRYVGAAAKWDSIDGAGVNAYWGHRNLFGGAEKLRIDAGVGRLITNKPAEYEYQLRAQFEKPGVITGFTDLLIDVEALRERTDAYWRDGVRGQVALRQRVTSELSIQGGIEAEGSNIRDTVQEKKFLLVGVPISATFDNTDNKLNPSKGIKLMGSAAPYYNAQGEQKSLNIFKAQFSTYFAFDEDARYILAGKIGVGSIVGPSSTEDVPANRRFFAGGGGSIRGFAFQSASPSCKPVFPRPKRALPCNDEDPFGGRSLLETSVEARIKVTDTIGVVPFVDAGAAFDSVYPDFKENVRVGAGLGLRYYTGIGPIRFDVATPVIGKTKADSRVAFYVSIGQSF